VLFTLIKTGTDELQLANLFIIIQTNHSIIRYNIAAK